MKSSAELHTKLLGLLALLVFTVGCGSTSSSSSKDAENRVAAQVERGPVTLEVAVGPTPIRFSDEPTLSIKLSYPSGVEIFEPPFGDALGDFAILDYRKKPIEVDGETEQLTIEYRLEPLQIGDLAVAPIVVEFKDNRQQDSALQELETEPLQVKVESDLTDDQLDLANLDAAAEPLTMDAPIAVPWIWIGVVAGMFIVISVVIIYYTTKKRLGLDAVLLTPREIAFLDLQRLIEENLAEEDVKAFYVRLTGVVRVFIEGTTGVNAPDQTTEEFLREVRGGDHFAARERDYLAAFLESADLVKYAAASPSANDIEEAFERAKRFIGLDAAASESEVAV